MLKMMPNVTDGWPISCQKKSVESLSLDNHKSQLALAKIPVMMLLAKNWTKWRCWELVDSIA